MVKTLIVMTGRVPTESDPRVAMDERAQLEIVQLIERLRAVPGHVVDCNNFDTVLGDRNPFVRLCRRLLGTQAAQALAVFLRRKQYDQIYSFGESAGGPVAFLLMFLRRRPRHICTSYVLGYSHVRAFFRYFGVHRAIDTMLVPCTALRDFAVKELRVPRERILINRIAVDTRFYRPISAPRGGKIKLASAGASGRDYATLVRALADLPEISLEIDPSGGPRFNRKTIPDVAIPGNVEFIDFEPGGLRKFYAPCDIVCVPVFDHIMTFGVTTILEAMAMAKPVIATRSAGLADFIIDGETCLTVAPGDVEGWKAAIRRLSADAALRERLGRNARRWVEENATLDIWTQLMLDVLQVPGSRKPISAAPPHEVAAASAIS